MKRKSFQRIRVLDELKILKYDTLAKMSHTLVVTTKVGMGESSSQ